MPKVSVVVPNYNHARYIGKRLKSVLDQTYQDFELLYLDDASTDASAEVFACFESDPRIRAILNETNSGSPFKQWNKGVREAQGEYIWIAEADDFADPRLLETLVDRLDQYPNVGVAYCQSIVVDEHDSMQFNVIETVQHLNPGHWATDFVNDGRDECQRALIFQNTIPNASAVVFRRDVYERAGYADENLRLAGDWRLWIKLLLISDVAFVAEPLNYFRKHSESVTHKSSMNGTEIKEYYSIASWIAEYVGMSPEARNRICEGVMALWMTTLPPQSSNLPWKQHYEIYRIAKAVDKSLERRLYTKALPSLLQASYRKVSGKITLPRRVYWSLNHRVFRHAARAYWGLNHHLFRRVARALSHLGGRPSPPTGRP